MSHHHPWLPPPPHMRQHDYNGAGTRSKMVTNGIATRSGTPCAGKDRTSVAATAPATVDEPDDAKLTMFKQLYAHSEARIAALFAQNTAGGNTQGSVDDGQVRLDENSTNVNQSSSDAPPKKAARTINEDDYDDYDAEDDEGESTGRVSVSKSSETLPAVASRQSSSSSVRTVAPVNTHDSATSKSSSSKTSEEVREKLQEDRKAAEDTAKRTFQTLFYTLENDRDAMLEQQKLEELDRQLDAEMSGHGGHANNANNSTTGVGQHGKLSNANLGASSLTLKHLIARIDAKRDQVRASDAELRSLMSEVRKNRSKWANEDRVGQEELYEAAEKVLSELKAMTEHSTAFLTRVNKRDAPDYHTIIKHPMDLGSMTKKLKSISYKSKREFVDDLNLIWSNCLKYNADPSHYLRKHALAMRKETDKLVPLIPDIVIRDRAEVEAEERRMQNGGVDVDIEGAEESDDEPIMSSRGRKAPAKKTKKSNTVRKAPRGAVEGSPGPESKPSIQKWGSSNSVNGFRGDMRRTDSDAPTETNQNGLATPPLGGPGTVSPARVNGVSGSTHPGSQVDSTEIDGFGASGAGIALPPVTMGSGEDVEHEDSEYKIWKQVTKKDRALVCAERHRLFKGNRINKEEPALLRTRAGMRRWLRKQRQFVPESPGVSGVTLEGSKEAGEVAQVETLAEEMEDEEDRVLPDYYDVLDAIPEISERLRWVEDSEGQLVDQSDEFLRILPKGIFTQPVSSLSKKIDANIKQMQETRKICSKIGIIKQMQLQSQMYQNQFQKYNPEPFVEQDIDPIVVSDDGPVMAPWVCRAALQRSVGKILYHTGFEEFQPSALDAITDIAGDFFTKLVHTIGLYAEAPKMATPRPAGNTEAGGQKWVNRFTKEEIILHSLHENGLDVESLENYVKDDVERLGSKLSVMHERMKSHLAELLRPALNNAGTDGSDAFNDGSEQFIGGDFAEEIDEDFFGFKELGLDKEFGLSSLSVPLHLLQNRVHSLHNAGNTSSAPTFVTTLEAPPPYEPITLQNLKSQIGLVQNFFLAKLHANRDEPLIEDEDLPQKQRFPKPRLPPTGKITSPRKRPIKEQGGGKSKKKKVEWKEGGDGIFGVSTTAAASAEKDKEKTGGGAGSNKGNTTTTTAAGKLKLAVPGTTSSGSSSSVTAPAGGNAPATNTTTTTATASGEGEGEVGGGTGGAVEAEGGTSAVAATTMAAETTGGSPDTPAGEKEIQ